MSNWAQYHTKNTLNMFNAHLQIPKVNYLWLQTIHNNGSCLFLLNFPEYKGKLWTVLLLVCRKTHISISFSVPSFRIAINVINETHIVPSFYHYPYPATLPPPYPSSSSEPPTICSGNFAHFPAFSFLSVRCWSRRYVHSSYESSTSIQTHLHLCRRRRRTTTIIQAEQYVYWFTIERDKNT